MPKLKTKSSVAKRTKVTKGGKVKRWKAYGGHILTKKSRKRKRRLKKVYAYVSKAEAKNVKRLLPYS